jgi:hypothetical protein
MLTAKLETEKCCCSWGLHTDSIAGDTLMVPMNHDIKLGEKDFL